MPTYLFRCTRCGGEAEINLTVEERDTTPVRHTCVLPGSGESPRMERVPASAAFIVNGFNAKNHYGAKA